MKYLMMLLCLGLLAGCSSGLANQEDIPVDGEGGDHPTAFRADLEDYGAAPELTNEVWLNTDQPLRLADLRGNVVLLEMWTFG